LTTIRTVPVSKDSGPPGPQGSAGASGVSTWIDLTDTDPTTFVGEKGKGVIVNSSETGLVFTDFPIQGETFLSVVSAPNVSDVVIGQPIYATGVGAAVDLAKADSVSTSRVIGIAVTGAISPGPIFLVGYGHITQTDWTAVTGVSGLIANSPYFLDPTTAGMLTTTAPTGSGELVVQVGVAVAANSLCVFIQPPILLV
jgi:hypothetical protein